MLDNFNKHTWRDEGVSVASFTAVVWVVRFFIESSTDEMSQERCCCLSEGFLPLDEFVLWELTNFNSRIEFFFLMPLFPTRPTGLPAGLQLDIAPILTGFPVLVELAVKKKKIKKKRLKFSDHFPTTIWLYTFLCVKWSSCPNSFRRFYPTFYNWWACIDQIWRL